MNEFRPSGRFDRIVSIEMFEHMANWRPLLRRMRASLEGDGRMFVHVFSHKHASYRFSAADKDDWIAQHYFTGGIMPSRGLIRQFADVSRSKPNGIGTAGTTRRLPSIGSKISIATRTAFWKSCAMCTAPMRRYGCAVGGFSSSLRSDCSATPWAKNGV